MRAMPRSRCWMILCALAVLLAIAPVPARAQFVLEHVTDTARLLGPHRAQGAVIWNHGKPPYRGADGDMLPFYLDRLRDAGWDVFKLERDWSSDDLVMSPAALRDNVNAVYQLGYRKVVLAGQSYGAWISLQVAAWGPPIHAVIAAAPAAFGRYPDSDIFYRNADELYPILQRIRNTRIMMFLFDDDPHDTGDRGAPAREILAANGVDNAVIAYPRGWYGHGAANWNGFATRFGPCITRFIDPRLSVSDAHCERDPVTSRAVLNLALPEFKPVAVQAGDPLTGLWYGIYRDGREALLSVERVRGGEVTALYGWGTLPRDEPGAPGYDRRTGRLQADGMRFAEPNRSTLDVKPLGPDAMSLTWTSSDGTRSDIAELRRLR